jgi:hypothetical protein
MLTGYGGQITNVTGFAGPPLFRAFGGPERPGIPVVKAVG